MMARIDILNDETGDLACVNGDFDSGISDDQHVCDILSASPGQYKQSPMVGASVRDAINGSLSGELKNRININLEADSYNVTDLEKDEQAWELDPGNLSIYVNYEPK